MLTWKLYQESSFLLLSFWVSKAFYDCSCLVKCLIMIYLVFSYVSFNFQRRQKNLVYFLWNWILVMDETLFLSFCCFYDASFVVIFTESPKMKRNRNCSEFKIYLQVSLFWSILVSLKDCRIYVYERWSFIFFLWTFDLISNWLFENSWIKLFVYIFQK